MKPAFRHPAAIIVWNDAHARNQAVEYEESEVAQQHRPETCTILGLVIREDETGISIYSEDTGPSAVRGLSFIPRQMVKSITYVNLTPVRPSRPKKARHVKDPLSHVSGPPATASPSVGPISVDPSRNHSS